MDEDKSLLMVIAEWLEVRKQRRSIKGVSQSSHWLPTPGNALFSLMMIVILLWAQNVGAVPFLAGSTTSTGTIAYQGRLASAGGAPVTQTIGMEFRLYAAATGGTRLWTEQWTGSNSVQVSDGLFNVMLGSLTPIPQSVIAGNSNLFLGITVGTDDEMNPRVQLGSVPFAVQALTVPDGSITKEKLAADVSFVPPDGSVTMEKIVDGAVTQAKAPLMIKSADGDNYIIRSGSTLVTTNTNGEVCVPLEYAFPNRVTSFVALNGDIYLNAALIVGTLNLEQYTVTSCVTVRTSAVNSTMRINWVAVGY